MPKLIQIRNVPDSVHRELKSRAALAGMSLSEYLVAELKRSLQRPTREQLLARIAGQSAVQPSLSPAEVLRRERARG